MWVTYWGSSKENLVLLRVLVWRVPRGRKLRTQGGRGIKSFTILEWVGLEGGLRYKLPDVHRGSWESVREGFCSLENENREVTYYTTIITTVYSTITIIGNRVGRCVGRWVNG